LPFGETLVWAFWAFVGVGAVGKSVSSVVDGEIIECADSWPQDHGDSEGAVVWILLVAPKNPSSMSMRGLLPEPALYVNEGVVWIPPEGLDHLAFLPRRMLYSAFVRPSLSPFFSFYLA
jgi:hypothetical protein